MKRRLALKLHGWAYRLAPEIAIAVRAVIIQQLATEFDAKQAAALAEHRERAARIARNQ